MSSVQARLAADNGYEVVHQSPLSVLVIFAKQEGVHRPSIVIETPGQ